MNSQELILSHLIYNEEYSRKVLPYIKPEYFEDQSDKYLFQLINYYTNKYNKLPSKEALLIDLEKIPNVSEGVHANIQTKINSFTKNDETDLGWLVMTTEEFCLNKSVYNAIMKSISIYDDKGKKEPISAIPTLLSEAIGVSFDNSIGHSFLNKFEDRWEYYNRTDVKIPFDIEYLNKITNGGLPPKTLSCILAGVGVGKSLTMCSMVANNLLQGKNVLYITLELSEEKIAERIEANLFDTNLDDIKSLGKEAYFQKAAKIKKKVAGNLIIKEYPPGSANGLHFKHLLQELKLKEKFIPDIIYVDYINLCSSYRIKMGQGANSYTYIKSVAEEIRGLAVEHNLPIMTATQLTRSGYSATDVGMEDTSECLDPDTKVIKINGDHVGISSLIPGDKILGTNGFCTVVKVHHPKIKKMFRIKTKSGKEIICSADHVFPTNIGRVCLNTGLKSGVKLKNI